MIILCEIFFAPAVHVEWVDTLHVYIHEFYKLFAQVCRYKIKPKVHFLLHYPTLIIIFFISKHLVPGWTNFDNKPFFAAHATL